MGVSGQPLSGASAYTLRFEDGKLPPVNASWSITMYDGATKTLVANPLNRYLINSPMLPNLVKGKVGSITIYVQHTEPEKAKEANWLPAPSGPFYAVMRLYYPKPEGLDGTWTAPPLTEVE